MTNLVDIQLQIDKLQKQAQIIKTKEFAKTVQDIRQKMQAFGITARDLQIDKAVKGTRSALRAALPAQAGKKARKTSSKLQGLPVAAKYRGPNGESWTGRGLMPRWLKTLVEQGRGKEEFLIVQAS